MLYFSDPKDYSIDKLRQMLVPYSAVNTYSLNYQLASAFKLQLNTFHPFEESHHYSMTSLQAGLSVYTSMNKKEAQQILSARLHQHDFYELMMVLEGSVFQNIENQMHLYTAGSCCLLNRNIRHTELYNEEGADFRIAFVQISDSLMRLIHSVFSLRLFPAEDSGTITDLEQFLRINLDENTDEKDYVEFIPRAGGASQGSEAALLMEELAGTLLSPHVHSSHRVLYLFTELFTLLSNKELYSTTPISIGTQTENRLFEQVRTLMDESRGRITRSELSEILHYSGSQISRVVHLFTGLSISAYGNSVCMREAARLLRTTQLSVQEIAEQLGFTNRTHFYRKFKEVYQLTPLEYRTQRR